MHASVPTHRLAVFQPSATPPAASAAALRVLLVEDSASDAALIQSYLDAGDAVGPPLTVRRVAWLAEARQVLASEPADIVLLDLSLPDADRLESLHALREQEPDLPIVVLTSSADDALAMDAVRAGAQEFLVKGREEAHAVRRAVRHAVERQHLLRAARAASRARDETLAIVSHDLRNALAGLEASVQAIQEDPNMAPERMQRTLAVMQRSAGWMHRLIQDLLDVSRLEAGQLALHLERLPVDALVRSLVAAHVEQARERGVALEDLVEPDGPWVRVDPDRVHQAIGNIVGNAIKFTPVGGRVVVSTTVPDAAGMVRIVVADTGPGIDSELLPHVFDRFWQARHARRGGAGLGLAIARGIVEAHGGTVTVDSTVGAGTTFTCALPVAGHPD